MNIFADWISVNMDVKVSDVNMILNSIDRKVVSVKAFRVIPMTYSTILSVSVKGQVYKKCL